MGITVETREINFLGFHLVMWANKEERGFLGENQEDNDSGTKRRMRVLERSYKKAEGIDSGKLMKMRDTPALRSMGHAKL
jgi:hypothetical protein